MRAASQTPARLEIPRDAHGCAVTVSKAGMVSQRIELKRDISAKFWGPFWTGVGGLLYLAALAASDGDAAGVVIGVPFAVFGLGSAAIDASTGAHRTHDPDEIEVVLVPER